jgi:hypothetical protein
MMAAVPYNRGVADRLGCRALRATFILTTRGTVEKALFSITCTTCRARLRVRSEEAIGGIHECPKCGSMVHVVPPEGWQPEAELARQSASSDTSALGGAEDAGPPCGSQGAAGVEGELSKVEGGRRKAESGKRKADSGDGQDHQSSIINPQSPIPNPQSPIASPRVLIPGLWLLAAAAGLVVVVGVCSIFLWRAPSSEQPTAPAGGPAVSAPIEQPPPSKKRPAPVPVQLDRRWLPDGTALFFSLRPSQLTAESSFGQMVGQLDRVPGTDQRWAPTERWSGWWRQTVGAVLESLGLKPQVIRRLTWAATDLAAWPQQSVVLIELEPGHDADSLESAGEAVDLELAGVLCRRLPNAPWKHPFAVIDRRTIVTGAPALLRHLAGRSEIHLRSGAIERLLPLADSDAELTLLMDLAAARRAGWRLPTMALDVWPPGKQAWHVVWEMSDGVGCRWQGSDRFRSELALVCEGETATEKVHAAVTELLPAARKWLSVQVQSLAGKPPASGYPAGQTTAAAADYALLLKAGLTAAEAARCEVVDGTVRVWVDWDRGPSALAAAAVDSRWAIRAAWLAAARDADEANYHRLLAGLDAYRQAEGRFPAAAAGSARLSTDERLSWIAALLPFSGYAEWHRQLDFAQPWNSPQNRPVTQQPLPEVVNPALGPGRTEAGFPVTHYVGVAGVGGDAAGLKADDPRAGVFGHGRTTRPEDIADGAANTIALLGVTQRLGPWAAGGDPTVRALTEPPYVNGPDGFGSGQPDGMLAGMADGSVRFISKDVDPRVLEQLATINGERNAAAVAADRRPVPPRPEPDRAGPEVEGPSKTPAEPPAKGPPEAPPAGPNEQPEPIQVDVEARLADTIPEIQLREVPLAEAVDLLAGLSTLPISFDPEAMQQLGVTLHDPVTVELSSATVGQVLGKVAASRGLAAVVEDGQLLLTSPADRREKLLPKRYTVSDLTGPDPTAVAELAALVEKLVAPDSWRPKGGRGTIEPDHGVLAVVQTAVVHDQILTFCEKLRHARGKPLRSNFSPDRFALESRLDRAKAMLTRPVTANFHEPTPLIEILAYLGKLAGADILVDRPALRAAGLSDRTKARMTVEKQPLGETLDVLLGPLELAYRVIDARTLQVTSRKAVAARRELEFYPVSELLRNGRTGHRAPTEGWSAGPALVEQIKGRLAGSTWSDAGGPGVLYFDQPSSCLIVLQSQPVQQALERLLAELRD